MTKSLGAQILTPARGGQLCGRQILRVLDRDGRGSTEGHSFTRGGRQKRFVFQLIVFDFSCKLGKCL